MTRLAGKVALITGAGSGIGRATATLFAREGARVAVVDRVGERAQEAVAAITKGGGEAIALYADVSRSEAVAEMVQQTLDRWGTIDILHSNAGISMDATPVEDIDDAFFDQMLAINVRSVFLCAKHVVPVMKRERGGVIINTASTAGVRPRPGASAYSASKGAVIALTKALAVELASYGIRAVCLLPFATDTPMLRAQLEGARPDQGSQTRLQAIPLGRFITPEEVAEAALYLASDAAAMLSGTALEIDGGRLLL
jgi:3-oxoacyl-[acyl-carrier protein] reductase